MLHGSPSTSVLRFSAESEETGFRPCTRSRSTLLTTCRMSPADHLYVFLVMTQMRTQPTREKPWTCVHRNTLQYDALWNYDHADVSLLYNLQKVWRTNHTWNHEPTEFVSFRDPIWMKLFVRLSDSFQIEIRSHGLSGVSSLRCGYRQHSF